MINKLVKENFYTKQTRNVAGYRKRDTLK